MNSEETTKWLAWHAGLNDRTTELPSIASATQDGLGDARVLDEAVEHVITLLGELNRDLNGPVPSESVGGGSDVRRLDAYAVSAIVLGLLQDAMVADDSRNAARLLRAAWRIHTAWVGVLAGDEDDLQELVDLEEAARFDELE